MGTKSSKTTKTLGPWTLSVTAVLYFIVFNGFLSVSFNLLGDIPITPKLFQNRELTVNSLNSDYFPYIKRVLFWLSKW